MTISPPNWCKNAVPSLRGWRHPKTGELLKSQGMSQAEISEYMGHDPLEHTHPDGLTHSHEGGDVPHTHEVEVLSEAMPHKGLDDMSKRELEALGRQHGIELDRRKNKTALLEELHDAGIAD